MTAATATFDAADRPGPSTPLARVALAMVDVVDRRESAVTVGFVDLVGFTSSTATMTTGELLAFVQRFQSRAHDVVSAHHGRVVKHIGDEIMFASMFPEVLVQAGECLVECDPRLRRLFTRSFPGATFFAPLPDGSFPRSLASHKVDLEVQAGTLAKHLRRRADDFPRHAGYLKADAGRVAYCPMGPRVARRVDRRVRLRRVCRGVRA